MKGNNTMNQEPKTTIEELMEECFELNQSFAGGSNYLHLTIRGNGRYEANTYGANPEYDATAIGALTNLKSLIKPRAEKEAAQALARAEEDLIKAQAKVEKLTALRNNLNP
jgi:hypothetical protein